MNRVYSAGVQQDNQQKPMQLPERIFWQQDGKPMVLIAAGPFRMGSDRRGRNEEHPIHAVFLPDYYMDRTPVTVDEYYRFCQATGRSMPQLYYPAGQPHDLANHPVTGVAWYDALAYAAWIGKRLPSEAEWEKAAAWDPHTQTSRMYPWGSTWNPKVCNCADNGIGMPTPVGWFSPYGDSAYGVADMAGNVFEWTSSLGWHYPVVPGDGRDDPNRYGVRVRRGGSYTADEFYMRTTARMLTGSDGRFLVEGFRCVADPPDWLLK